MNNRMKMGAATLVLAALASGCAPTPTNNAQAGATTGDYGSSSGTDYGYGSSYNTGTTGGTTNTSYSDYGTGGTSTGSSYGTGGSSSYYDYSAPGSSTSSGSSYSSNYSSGSSYSSGGYASNSAGGSYAVQVVASSNRSTADAMVGQMSSMGFNAVIDQVGGLYKVRVPFGSESEAKSNLGRIRSSVPDAFFTVR